MAIDPDIQAAFSDTTPAPTAGGIDSDVAAAFGGGSQGEPVSFLGDENFGQQNAPSWGERVQHVKDVASIAKRHPFTVGVGLLENQLSGITGGVGQLADTVTGSDPGAHDWAFRPRTEAGKEIAQQASAESAQQGKAYDASFGTGPLAQTIKERVPQALGSIGTVTAALSPFKGTAFDSPLTRGAAPELAGSPQSISAAASAPNLAAASPELREAAQEAQANGTFNRAAFERQLQAESLPVPGNLTKGQATQDPVLISNEKNMRGKNPEFATRFNEQNQNLIANMDHMREEVGPDVFSAHEVEHGRTMIKAYEDKAAAANADIRTKYQALRDANGGQFPVDAKTLQSNVSAALHSKLLYEHAPTAEMNQLSRAVENGMTFEQYEAMRTNLARIMRSSSDGNEVAAAGVIRSEIDKLPLSGDAAKLKPLADAARSAAKTQFDAVAADPAYKAVVAGKVSPDDFVQRFIVNGNTDDVALMKKNMQGNPTAQQTMGVAALDYIRQRATNGGPTLRQSGYNRALQNLEPKLGSLFSPDQRETLQNIGEVARNQQIQPEGSFVNNSNTTVAAHAAGLAKTGAEGIINAKTFGVGGTLGRKFLEGRAAKKLVDEHLAPGAGVDFAPGHP